MGWAIGVKIAVINMPECSTQKNYSLTKNTSAMRKVIGPLVELSRNAVPNAKSGNKKANS